MKNYIFEYLSKTNKGSTRVHLRSMAQKSYGVEGEHETWCVLTKDEDVLKEFEKLERGSVVPQELLDKLDKTKVGIDKNYCG